MRLADGFSLRGNNNRGKVRSGVTGDEQLIESFPRFLGNFQRLETKKRLEIEVPRATRDRSIDSRKKPLIGEGKTELARRLIRPREKTAQVYRKNLPETIKNTAIQGVFNFTAMDSELILPNRQRSFLLVQTILSRVR